LSFLFLLLGGLALVVLGDAVADERLIGRLDLPLGSRLQIAARDRKLATRQQAALLGSEGRTRLTQSLAPHQELAILRQPVAERRLTQQRFVRDLHDVDILAVGVLAAVPDQQTLVREAVD